MRESCQAEQPERYPHAMAAMAAHLAPRNMRLFDRFSVVFIVSVSLFLATAWLIVDRAVVTDSERLDALADRRFDQEMPDGLRIASVEREADSVTLVFQDDKATDRTFARNNAAHVLIQYQFHDSGAAAAKRMEAEEPRSGPMPKGLPKTVRAELARVQVATAVEAPQLGVPAVCADWTGVGATDCVYLRGRMTIWVSSRIPHTRDGGPSYYVEIARAAIAHLKEAGG